MKFVEKIADHIYTHNYDLNDLTIILPSERMRKYLQSALFDRYGKPILSPQITTIDRWVKLHSDRSVVDKTRLLLELFKIQLKDAKTEEDKSFDEFLTWGEILLSDFNEIDRYCLNPKQVFRNLSDIKELESWNFDSKEPSDAQKRFMEFWERIEPYYTELNKQLDKNGQTYMGSAYKWFSENLDVVLAGQDKKRFLFAGFNALSPSEVSIIRQLKNYGRAELLIDADRFYLDDRNHEAGMFLRNTLQDLEIKEPLFVEENLKTKKIDVDLIECAQNTGQVKAMSTILSKLSPQEVKETLLLLADESLINSVVRNLPATIQKANITLGMPIKNSAVRSWVELIFSIQENKLRFRTEAIYYADLQNLWNHPFVLALLDDEEKKMVRSIDEEVIRYNKIFVNAKNLNTGPVMTMILDALSLNWNNNWGDAIAMIRKLNQQVYQKLDSSNAFERAIIECFDVGLKDFENIITEGIPEMSLRSFRHLFNQSWQKRSIAYHGNPIDGLQIMGMLETRGLDFKRIICLGMNEGNLPPTNPIQTMIPMDLRKYYGLPTPREKQGIFGHHFYRLLHKAEHVTITYSTAEESIGFNEPSRYILQLQKEMSRENTNIQITKKIYTLKSDNEKRTREVKKTVQVIQRMDQLFANSTSASMIKKYNTCPLDFYYRYVMDFGEEEIVEEEIDHSTFGTMIHETLEDLYTPFARHDKKGNKVKPEPPAIKSVDVEKMLKEFELTLHQKFMKHFNNDKEAFQKGKNYLSYQMAKELTKRFLKAEIKFLAAQTKDVHIESLERSFESDVDIEVNGVMKKVRLRGFVDRIDRVGNEIRIIDYKSGKVDEKKVKFGVRGDQDTIVMSGLTKNDNHLLQLVQYAFLYYDHLPEGQKVIPTSSIISFVSNKQQPLTLNGDKIDLEDVIINYPKYLGNILNEIYDESISFEHTSYGKFSYCKYCD